MSRLVLVGMAALLLGAACDKFRVPARPASGETDTTVAAATPPAATKPNRPARRASSVDAGIARLRFDAIRRGLRRLVVAEETYYAENGVYTDDLSRLGFAPEDGGEVRFLWLARGGWAASGSHRDVPGRDCVVFVGRTHGAPTTMHDVRVGREGTPVCDGVPARSLSAPSVAPTPAAAADRPAAGEAVSGGSGIADTGNALDAVDPSIQMRVDLRNLVRSQDTYFGTQGVYSRRTEPFALQYLWHKGVRISILSANDASWAARATHVAWPGKSCVIWLGPVAQRPATDADKRAPDQPGMPVCDD